MVEVTEWFAELFVLMFAHLWGPYFGKLLMKGINLLKVMSDSAIPYVAEHAPLVEEIIELTEEVL